MSTPNYTPAPQSANSYLGSVVGKQNYQQIPPSNPATDFDSTLISPGFVDVSRMTLVCPKVFLQFSTGTSTGALDLLAYSSMWFNSDPGTPVLAYVSTGVYTFTFPTYVSQEYTQQANNVSQNIPVVLTGGVGSFATIAGMVAVNAGSANVITVSVFNSSGSAHDFTAAVINLYCF
jgi:hypothetical protein